MAKRKPAPKTTSEDPPKDPRPLAIMCICAVTGCGKTEAERRIGKMNEAKVNQLAECYAKKELRKAIQVLYR